MTNEIMIHISIVHRLLFVVRVLVVGLSFAFGEIEAK